MITNVKVLNDLLNRACDIITSLEGYTDNIYHYQGSYTQRTVDDFFNEVDMLKEENMYRDTDPDLVAQDWDAFGENKI